METRIPTILIFGALGVICGVNFRGQKTIEKKVRKKNTKLCTHWGGPAECAGPVGGKGVIKYCRTSAHGLARHVSPRPLTSRGRRILSATRIPPGRLRKSKGLRGQVIERIANIYIQQ